MSVPTASKKIAVRPRPLSSIASPVTRRRVRASRFQNGRSAFRVYPKLSGDRFAWFMAARAQLQEQAEWRQSNGEEFANSLSHGLGFLAAAVAGPILLAAARERGGAPFFAGTVIFVA